jgi:hypothetical protein
MNRSDFFDQGYEQHKDAPDMLLAEVWRFACMFIDDQENARAFVEGYTAARKQRDEHQKED